MRTAIMTDSNSGVAEEEAGKRGIYVLPMPVFIDDKIYFEGKNLSQELFYESLMSGGRVKTSQPSPGAVVDLWETLLADGYEEIVYIPMSSGLSSSCQTALRLAKEYGEHIQVADNHRISVTQKQSVLEAVKLAGNGYSAAEIKKYLEKNAYAASIYIAVDTMEFLKKGGRVTPAAAAIGSMFDIKPVLTIQGGKLDAYAKIRGMKRGRKKMLEAVKNDLDSRFAGADLAQIKIGVAGSFLTKDGAEEWKNEVLEAFKGIETFYDPLTFSIGCHVGPNAAGIGICKTEA